MGEAEAVGGSGSSFLTSLFRARPSLPDPFPSLATNDHPLAFSPWPDPPKSRGTYPLSIP